MSRIVILILIYSFVLRFPPIQASCVEVLENDPKYQECNLAFMSYLANAGSSGGTGEGNQMVQIMCKNEGKAAMTCMNPFYDNCSELESKPQLSIFAQVKVMGGLDQLCGQVSGPCADAQKCFNEIEFDVPPVLSSIKHPTIYDMFLEHGKIICGPLQKRFECLTNLEGECPDLEKQIETMVEMSRQSSTVETPWPKYSAVKKFATTDCQKLPEDFMISERCNISAILMTPQYRECYNTTSSVNNQTGSKCESYSESFKCVEEALDDADCGKQYTDGTRAVANLFLSASPSTCTLETRELVHVTMRTETPTGCAKSLTISVTLLFAFKLIITVVLELNCIEF